MVEQMTLLTHSYIFYKQKKRPYSGKP